MPDDRDALAALIAENEDDPPEWGGSPQEWGERLADAILKAGWRPPRKEYPPHDVDVMYAAVCTGCGRDLQWDECVNDWTH